MVPPAWQCLLSRLTVFAATRLETWVARRAVPRGVTVARVGVGLRAWSPPPACPFVSCGLAGSLSTALPPGTVVIPEWVGTPGGERLRCHAPLVEALVAAARALGYEPVTGPMITTPQLVTGEARAYWGAKGFVAADMETGLLLRWYARGAAVRVILDAPQGDLSATWEHPARILLAPWLWPQAVRISQTAPRYARRAAAIVARAATCMA